MTRLCFRTKLDNFEYYWENSWWNGRWDLKFSCVLKTYIKGSFSICRAHIFFIFIRDSLGFIKKKPSQIIISSLENYLHSAIPSVHVISEYFFPLRVLYTPPSGNGLTVYK